MKRLVIILSVVVTCIFLPSASIVFTQEFCKGNFDYDDDVDGSDANILRENFGRGTYENPCPPDGPAPVPKTGRTTSTHIGDDGDLQKGVTWPNPH